MKTLSSLPPIGLAFLVIVLTSCTSIFSSGEEVSQDVEQIVASELVSTEEADPVSEDPFGKAVNTAMAASEAAQSARSMDEWHNVANLWSQAIEFMIAVPESHSSYTTAQEKAIAYQPNLEYAKQNTPVILNATAQADGQKVTVLGETNLPDGFIMSVSGSRYHIEPNGPHVMSTVHKGSDAKATVSEGRFQAEITIPTVQQVKQGLIEFGGVMEDPSLSNSPINEHADIYIVGTPANQDDSMLQLIGGSDGLLLIGSNTDENSGFRVVDLNLKVDM